MAGKEKRDWSKVERSRPNQISFRVTDEEKELIERFAESAQVSRAEYARKRALGGLVKRPLMDKESAQETVKTLVHIQKELNKQGNNVNQIAKNLNILAKNAFITKKEQENAQEEAKELLDTYQAFNQEIQEIFTNF